MRSSSPDTIDIAICHNSRTVAAVDRAGARMRKAPGGICQKIAAVIPPVPRVRDKSATMKGRRVSGHGASFATVNASSTLSQSGSAASSSRNPPANNVISNTNAPRATNSSPTQTATSAKQKKGHSKIPENWERDIIALVHLWSEHCLRLPHQLQIAHMANAFLKWIQKSNIQPVSDSWPGSMFKRHPEFERWWKERKVAGSTQEKDKKRERKRLGQFICDFTKCIREKGIPSSNIYVVSHRGYATVVPRDGQLTVPHPKKKKPTETRQMASVISAFAADGRSLRPYVIFKTRGESPRSDWVESIRVSWNTTGWVVDHGILFDWLEKTFERKTNSTRTTGEDAPARLLLLDCEKFEITPDFFVFCRSRNIELFAFPQGSGKLSEPLETGLTSIIDGRYTRDMKRRYQIMEEAYAVPEASFCNNMKKQFKSEDLIREGKQAWKNSCLVPANPDGLRVIVDRNVTTPRTNRHRDVSIQSFEGPESSDEGEIEGSECEEPRTPGPRSRPGVHPDSAIHVESSGDESSSEDEDGGEDTDEEESGEEGEQDEFEGENGENEEQAEEQVAEQIEKQMEEQVVEQEQHYQGENASPRRSIARAFKRARTLSNANAETPDQKRRRLTSLNRLEDHVLDVVDQLQEQLDHQNLQWSNVCEAQLALVRSKSQTMSSPKTPSSSKQKR